jgi:hypothetical protein
MTTSAAVTAQPTSPIQSRVEELRALAKKDPAAARDQTWEWFKELGGETAHDRAGGSAKLNELFRLGVPPADIDGQTEGILVAPLIAGPVDAFARRLTAVWMPWLGKRFDKAAARGDNVLATSARWPAKLLWPFYSMGEARGGKAAFDFETGVEPGKVDPDVDVLKIDYAPMERNPRFIIKPIRDELVEIVAGANLGKILWHSRKGDYTLIGYFALKS